MDNRNLPPHFRLPQPMPQQPYVPQTGSPFDVQASVERIRRASQQAQQLQANTERTADGLMTAGRDYADQQQQQRDAQMDATFEQDVAAAMPKPPQGFELPDMTAGMTPFTPPKPKPLGNMGPGLKKADNKQRASVDQAAADIPVEGGSIPEFDLGMTESGPRYDQAAGEAVARNAQTKMAADQARTFGSDRPGDRGNLLPPDAPAAVPKGFSENSEAPLPGEETLPPAVAAWNDRRAKAGVRDGLKTLEQAYESAFDRDPTLPDFATWVKNQGILPDMPVEEANARLDAIVGESIKAEPGALPGKGYKDDRQKHQELVDKRAQQQQAALDMRGRQWVRDKSKQFAGQIGAESLEAAYQNGLQEAISKGSKNPHLDAVKSANASLVDGLRNGKAQQIRMNVKQQADQYNRARRMGLPQQIVTGLDGLADAATPDEKFRALTVLHAQAPMMGFDKMAAMVAKGQIDQQALGAWAQQMGGKPSFDSDFARWNNAPLSTGSYAGLVNLAHQMAGAGATPEQIDAKVRELGTGRATQAVNAMMTGGQIGEGDVQFVRQLSSGMNFDQFAQTFGLDTQSQDARRAYEKITGRPVGIRMFDDAPGWIAGGISAATGAAQQAAGVVGGWFRGQPQKPAQAQKPAAEPDPFA